MFRYKHYCDVLETVNNKMASDSRVPVSIILQLLRQKLEATQPDIQRCQYVTNYRTDVAEEVSPTAVSCENFQIPRTLTLFLCSCYISVAQHPKWGLGRLTVEVSRSHTIRHTHTPVGLLCTRYQSVAQAATYTTHNKHKRRTSTPSAGSELALPEMKRPQTYALEHTVTGQLVSRVHLRYSLLHKSPTFDLIYPGPHTVNPVCTLTPDFFKLHVPLTFPIREGLPSYLVAWALSTKIVYAILSSAVNLHKPRTQPVLAHTSVNPQFGLSLFPLFFIGITYGCRFCMGADQP